MDAQRQAVRDSMMQLVPPTKEEIVRTIFIGGITEGAGGDDGVERILRCAGNLRRWTRAIDAENKACRFGFAEYEDPESLATAIDVLKDVEVPVKPQPATIVKKEEDEDDKIEKSALLVRHGSHYLVCYADTSILDPHRRWFIELLRAVSSFSRRSRPYSSSVATKRCQERPLSSSRRPHPSYRTRSNQRSLPS